VKRALQPYRTPFTLSDSIHQQLNRYAVAASAAGVSLLALAQPSEAKIVYTPAHVAVPRGYPGLLLLDLNHDGTADFKFENWWNTNTTFGPSGTLSVFPAEQTNGILGYGTAGKYGLVYFASALRAGALIGPKASFFSPQFIDWMFRASYGWGQWKDVRNRYLGFRFAIRGKTHYGWARLTVTTNKKNLKITAILTGYAYETVPNKAIVAGQTQTKSAVEEDGGINQPEAALIVPTPKPATLGLLAMGSSGLSIWRREDAVEATH